MKSRYAFSVVVIGASMVALLFPVDSGAQVRQFGMEKQYIAAIAAEQGDRTGNWYPPLANMLFVASAMDGMFWADASHTPASWNPIGPFRDAPVYFGVLGVQHWGAGPRDGLHLFAAVRSFHGDSGMPVLWRATISPIDSKPPDWVRADSGIMSKDTATVVYSVAAYHYTGHTPPQPVLAGTGERMLQGSAGGVFWAETMPRTNRFNAVDVMPKWYGNVAWAVGGEREGDPYAYKSTDQGRTWKVFALPNLPIGSWGTAVAIAPGTSDTVYASAAFTVFRTTDGGASWVGALHNNTWFTSLACDPENPSHVYAAGAAGFKLHFSSDYGVTWTTIQPPATDPPDEVTCMTVAMTDSIPMSRPPRLGLFLGTRSTGVWLYDMSSGPLGADHPKQPEQVELSISPNPASQSATLEFTLDGKAAANIDVLDVLGRVVASPAQALTGSGNRMLTIDTRALVPGRYFVCLADGRSVVTAPLIIVR